MRSYALTECDQLYEARARWLYWFVALIALLWLGLLLLAPWLMATGRILPALVWYRVFALVCHQQPERSFSWWNFPLPVCMRCTSIYVGFAAGWLFSLRLPALPRRWLFVALTPLAIDWILGVTGLWANTPTSRTLTGALAGGALAWWLCYQRHSIVADLQQIHSGETFLHG